MGQIVWIQEAENGEWRSGTRYLSGLIWKAMDVPPDFLAPSLFPGPSFALFTAPCALWEACRTFPNLVPARHTLSCAKASLRATCGCVEDPTRPIEAIAARNGGCNRGSSMRLLCAHQRMSKVARSRNILKSTRLVTLCSRPLVLNRNSNSQCQQYIGGE